MKERLDRLCKLIPKDEMERVLNSDASAEIDQISLTCLDYEPLAKLIPTHWTVIDFGASYNAQSYWFKNHKRLISVDSPFGTNTEFDWHFERFMPPWCEFYEMTIAEWLNQHLHTVDLQETFAICGYVPSNEVDLVRSTFPNLFIYYPSNKKRWDFETVKNNLQNYT